jgi:hypothetical protein
MKTKLTSKYYLIRIAKSKDMIDLVDAVVAYAKFKKDRRDYALSQYCNSIKKNDLLSAWEACFIPAM